MFAYALFNGTITHVSSVERGLACNCSCCYCGAPLIAKKGKERADHFAHAPGIECSGALESALHAAAKNCLLSMSSIVIPPFEFVKNDSEHSFQRKTFRRTLAKGGEVAISNVELEKPLFDFVPDALILSGEKTLILEIFVTHKVDEQKLKKIRNCDIPAIEVFLGKPDALLCPEQLKEKLKNHIQSKTWLYHPKLPAAENEYKIFIAGERQAFNDELDKQANIEAKRTPEEWWNLAGVGHRERKNIEYQRANRLFQFRHKRMPTIDELRILGK